MASRAHQDLIKRAWRAALDAVEPGDAVGRACRENSDLAKFLSPESGRLTVLAFGKASKAMVAGADSVVGALGGGREAYRGLISNLEEPGNDWAASLAGRLETVRAGHPRPNTGSFQFGRGALEAVRPLDAGERVLVLVSGGGSAMMEAPVAGVTHRDLQKTTDFLVRSGADITDINAVRKHLSRVKGGRLARAIRPATWRTLAVSDVVGDRADTIASGPTVADSTSFCDAAEVLEGFGDGPGSVPPRVERWIEAGKVGRRLETPWRFAGSRDQRWFHAVATLSDALDAASSEFEAAGFRVSERRSDVTGEAKKVGEALAERVVRLGTNLESGEQSVVVWGGEATVSIGDDFVPGADPRGGPCQEVALAAGLWFTESASRALLDNSDVTFAALSTDGIDGPTDAAGAVVSQGFPHTTPLREARRALETHASYKVLDDESVLVRSGPTGTNVNDLYVAIVQTGES